MFVKIRNIKWRWVIIGGIVIGTAFLLVVLTWYQLALRPVQPNSKTVESYTLAPGTGVYELSADLDEKGIIRSAKAFTIYVVLTGRNSKLEAGNYELEPKMAAPMIAKKLAGGDVAQNQLLVPEGMNTFKIRDLVKDKGVSEADFNAAINTSAPNSYGRPAGVSLEGYLFPDSYQLPKPLTATALVQIMQANFDQKLRQNDLAAKFAAEGLTVHQGVTLASIVEKEVSRPADRAKVAGVFLNRLKAGMPLESDVTVDYAAKVMDTSFNTGLDSPYNTYHVPGLPIGPICNPGLDSMKAVASPVSSDYLYFVADKSGNTYYAKTFAEHQNNVNKYMNH